MKTILEKIDTKMVTAGGGLLLAGALVYLLYIVLTNDLTHVYNALNKHDDTQQQTNEVLRTLSGAIESQTKIMEIIERRIE